MTINTGHTATLHHPNDARARLRGFAARIPARYAAYPGLSFAANAARPATRPRRPEAGVPGTVRSGTDAVQFGSGRAVGCWTAFGRLRSRAVAPAAPRLRAC